MLLKDRIRDIIDPRKSWESRIFNTLIQILIVGSIIGITLELLMDMDPQTKAWVDLFEVISVAVFTIEYLLRLWVAERRLKFFTSFYGLVDLLAILPFYLSIGIDLRSFLWVRLLRLARLFKLLRYDWTTRLYLYAFSIKGRVIFLVILPVLVAISTLGIFAIEGGNVDGPYGSLFNSLWWTVVTFTTVGYGDMTPKSIPGRTFGLFVLGLGVLINSIIISMISTWFFSLRSSTEKGLKAVIADDHILICSDNPTFIRALLMEHADFVEENEVVVITPMNRNPMLGTPFAKVPWVHGDSCELEILTKASAQTAKIAYVDFEDDSETVMTVMQLELINPKVKTMAQYLIHEYQAYLKKVGCDYALKTYDLYVPLMLHACVSQGLPVWIREMIMRFESPTIETHAMSEEFAQTGWLDYTLAIKKRSGQMPLGYISAEGVMHLNPPTECIPGIDSQVLTVVPPPVRPMGDCEGDGFEITGNSKIRDEGHIIIASDEAAFISRILEEIEHANLEGDVVVLTTLNPFPDKVQKKGLEWIQISKLSDYGAHRARASEARIVFVDNEHDSHTLMMVLRFESMTQGEVFTVASYRQPGFDDRLSRVGCDFCVNVDELIAPALSQHALHPGVGELLERVVIHSSDGENLALSPIADGWEGTSWLDTIAYYKSETGRLPVGLIRAKTNQLYVNPGPEFTVLPEDELVLLEPRTGGPL